MELIQLTPHSEIDPSQPLRAPGDILLHAYLIPSALNPAQLARRTGIPSNQIKAFIAETHPSLPRSPSAFPSPSTPLPFTGWRFRRGTIWKGQRLWSAPIVRSLIERVRATGGCAGVKA